MSDNPILNNPYAEPRRHYATNARGELDYADIRAGRRLFTPEMNVIPLKQGPQKDIFEVNDFQAEYGTHFINRVRQEVGQWRADNYQPAPTRVTRELLDFWFRNPDRHAHYQLFFAQREAIETAIWLNEIADKSNPGQRILRELQDAQQTPLSPPASRITPLGPPASGGKATPLGPPASGGKQDIPPFTGGPRGGDPLAGGQRGEFSFTGGPRGVNLLPRIAFKMATGTGKTVVMAALILYHFLNRQEYRQDTRFADYFLVVTPGITIRDRLNVLFVDKTTPHKHQRRDYYAVRDLVPAAFASRLDNLNARLVVANYHAFEPRTLQGNKRSPYDGKIGHDAQGNPIRQEAGEDFNQVIKRVLGKFKRGSRLLVLNDEAHHCYLPKSAGKTQDSESDENAKAAVWFTGLSELSARFKLNVVYDLSATPYYLQGSGYPPYSLFNWVVSDFGLIEAIESGLVKIPFLPESDDTQELSVPVLRNLYDHVKDQLPKKGQRKQKKEAKAAGAELREEPPKLPPLVQGALDQFYNHYVEYAQHIRTRGEAQVDLLSKPPVFIAVCNNTSVSKEVYKHIAGYEYTPLTPPASGGENENASSPRLRGDQGGSSERRVVTGHYDLFSNYDQQGRLKRKAPTLLIDSEALEETSQIHAEFKTVFAAELEEFKRDYAALYGHGAVEQISDAEILREVVNTVGQPGKLGGHIRCVVSVSMLTEGWDARTVTHIMGLRAFGSQLLCEQVAGRALRRTNYFLQAYDTRTGEPIPPDRLKRYNPEHIIEKFPPEYAHIIGVPFNMFKGGQTTPPVESQDYTHIAARPDRQAQFEITFPNLDGYRVEYADDDLRHDFSGLENYEFDGSKFPTETILASAFLPHEERLQVQTVLAKREQELVYLITRTLLRRHFSDDDGNVAFHRFNQLKTIVTDWYRRKVLVLNLPSDPYQKLLFFEDPHKIADHIVRGVNPHRNTAEFVRPSLNHYNPFGSTKYVNGQTSKEVYPTEKSHVNLVVLDSGWEGICAKTLEELDAVASYVKNQFLGLAIPYVKDGKQDRQYFPDFVARVKTQDGRLVNLLIEITGMNKDKVEKTWFVANRWLPAVNAVRAKYGYDAWHFIEIANDIRNIRNQLREKIEAL